MRGMSKRATGQGQPAATPALAQQLQLAWALLQRGQLQEVILWGEQAVRGPGASVQTYLLLSRAWRMSGRPDLAEAHCLAALDRFSGDVDLMTALALAQREAGKPDAAEATCRRALSLAPTALALHQNLANLLQTKGELDEARASYKQVLALQPGHALAHFELGNVARKMGDAQEALQHYTLALADNSQLQPAWQALAALHEALEQWAPASSACHAALALKADDVSCWLMLARASQAQGDVQQSLAAAREAARLAPGAAQAFHLQALAWRQMGRVDASLQAAQQGLALASDPTLRAECLFLQAAAQLDLGDLQGAAHSASQLTAAAANAAQQALVCDVFAAIATARGQIDESMALSGRSIELVPDRIEPRQCLCAVAQYHGDLDGAALRQVAQDAMQPLNASAASADFSNPRVPDKVLRVGYLSGDLRRHSCAFFLEPLWQHHNPAEVEVVAYATSSQQDEVTDRLKALVHTWRDVGHLSADELCQQWREDGIDILVDLSGFTQGGRPQALAQRAAPVQMAWLGYLGTSGLKAMDHRLSDPWANPPEHDGFHTEAIVRLPRPYVCFKPDLNAPAVSPLPMLHNGHVTFGSFNVLQKVSPACVAAWAGVLRRVPGSRLVLKAMALADQAARDALLQAFSAHSISPERIECLAWVDDAAHHLSLYGRIDVALDTYPYNGVTTTCEALWMGVPVVSRVGDALVSRQGLSFLTAVGLPHLAVTGELAVADACSALVADSHALSDLRAGMRARMQASPLMDGRDLALHVEAAYRAVWSNWCAGGL